MSFQRYKPRNSMRTVNPHERRMAQTMQSFAYDGFLSADMAPGAHGDGIDDENGEHLSSSQVEVKIEKEIDTAQFKKRLHTHLEEQPSACTPHILIGQLGANTSIQKPKGLGFMSTKLGCCYYSSLSKEKNQSVFGSCSVLFLLYPDSSSEMTTSEFYSWLTDWVIEIWYNLTDGLSYDVPDPDSPAKLSEESILLKRAYQPLYFSYNLCTGHSTYLLTSQEGTPSPIEWIQLERPDQIERPRLHPFIVHLLLMYNYIRRRKLALDSGLRRLIAAEYNLLWNSIADRAAMGAEENKAELQSLHDLGQALIILEHYNNREQSTIDNLLRDLDRLRVETNKLPESYPIDLETHERIKDAFLCLKDFCKDRGGRLSNRKQRVQNLIALVYNLMANRDSTTNLQIAAESTQIAKKSASIAYETRRDSAAMKTIATLTMLYLPATFVCSLFGTNFFALSTNGPGDPVFVVSDLWWMYLVSAVPLTLLNLFVWRVWLRWRRNRRNRRPSVGEKENIV